jgi:hypothetical protein
LLLITKQAEFFDLNHMIKIKKSDDLNLDLNQKLLPKTKHRSRCFGIMGGHDLFF